MSDRVKLACEIVARTKPRFSDKTEGTRDLRNRRQDAAGERGGGKVAIYRRAAHGHAWRADRRAIPFEDDPEVDKEPGVGIHVIIKRVVAAAAARQTRNATRPAPEASL
jgi:hypothetical protein